MIGSEMALAANMRFASRAGLSISRPFRKRRIVSKHQAIELGCFASRPTQEHFSADCAATRLTVP